MAKMFEKKDINKILKKHLDEEDVYRIKDNMYTLDFWIADTILDKL
jgi:hypothetical protein